MAGSIDGPERGEWEGYSDYRTVSRRIGRSVDDAIDAYAMLESMHSEGDRVRPGDAAEAKSRMLSAALRLVPELREEQGNKDVYEAIIERWVDGEGEDYEGPDGGYIDGLSRVSLTSEWPDWLYQFVIDIRTAGWHLGYLRAGRREDQDRVEFEPADVTEMF